MALVIDSSSPAAHQIVNVAANTCAAFVPPDSPLLLAAWAGDAGLSEDPAQPVIASAPSQSWSVDVWDHYTSGAPTTPGQAAFMHSAVSGSPGSTTVTVTNQSVSSLSKGSTLKVYVITGHSLAAPIGVVGAGRQTSGSSLSDSYTASITGGQGFMVVSDWSAIDTTNWVAATGCTIVDVGTISGEISYAIVRRTDPDGVIGVSTTLGLTGLPTGGQFHWAYAEVISQEAALAAEGQAGYPARGASPPMF